QNPGFSFAAADGHGEDENNQHHAHSSNNNNEGGNQGIGIGECVGNILIYLIVGGNNKVVPVNGRNVLHSFNDAVQFSSVFHKEMGFCRVITITIFYSHFLHRIEAAKS